MAAETKLVLVSALPLGAAVLAYLLAWSAPRLANVANGVLAALALAGSAGLALALSQVGGAQFATPWLQFVTVVKGQGEVPIAIPFALLGGSAQLSFGLVTAVIALIVVLFSMRERRGDPRAGLFFATLALFAGAMLLLLTASTLLVIFMAWELMGLCSYLLIAHKGTPAALRAARQAFWTTRATDFALLFFALVPLGALGLSQLTDINAEGIASLLAESGRDPSGALAIFATLPLLLLIATLGKSALFPLSFWLSDAMEAPSPVSALLHAATMVAAGPYLLMVVTPLCIAPGAEAAAGGPLALMVLFGGGSAIFCGLMALFAREAKRVLAYSTVSQLGVMVLGVGVLAISPAFTQLMAHAWFKAALFLAVGYLIHEYARVTGDDHPTLYDLAGSARGRLLPSLSLVLAGLSLAGLWPLGGALGKEGILDRAGFSGAGILLLLSALITAAYTARLVIVLLFGKRGAAEKTLQNEKDTPVVTASAASVDGDAPLVDAPLQPQPAAGNGWTGALMLVLLLAVMGSIGTTALNFAALAETNWGMLGLSMLALAIGAAVGNALARPSPRLAQALDRSGLVSFLANGMYLREFWTGLVGGTGEFMALLFGFSDIYFIDWLALRFGALGRYLSRIAGWADIHIVDGGRFWVCETTWIIRRVHQRVMQTGVINHYMFIVLLSGALLCIVVLRELSRVFGEILRRV